MDDIIFLQFFRNSDHKLNSLLTFGYANKILKMILSDPL